MESPEGKELELEYKMVKTQKKSAFLCKNKLIKAHTRAFLVLVIVMLTSISLVSAFEFDNVKNYDAVNKEVTIVNAFGLGSDIAKIKLDTPLEVYVIRGKDRLVAEFTIDNFGDYAEVFNDLRFYDTQNKMSEFTRTFNYKYKETYNVDVDDYKETCKQRVVNISEIEDYDCSKTLTGSHSEERFRWIDYNGKALIKGNITIGIFTDVKANERIEWIPTFFGVDIDDWAVWTEALDEGLYAYYKLDETSGLKALPTIGDYNLTTNSTSVNWTTGLINNGLGFKRNTKDLLWSDDLMDRDWENLTMSMWVKFDNTFDNTASLSSGLMMILLSQNTNQLYCYFNSANGLLTCSVAGGGDYHGGMTSATSSWTGGVWQHILFRWDDTTNNLTLWVNGANENDLLADKPLSNDLGNLLPISFGNMVQTPASYGMYNATMDEIGIWNRALTDAEITQLYNGGAGISQETDTTNPEMTILIPANASFSGSPFSLQYTYVEGSPDRCWYSNDSGIVNSSTVAMGTNWTGLTRADGYTNITLYCNDTKGLLNSTINYFTVHTVNPEISITHPINNSLHSISTLDLNYTFVEALLGFCWYSNDSGIVNSSTVTMGVNWTDLGTPEGNANWTVYCNDSSNNLNSSIVYFSVDTTFPEINITEPAPNSGIKTTTFDLNYTFTETNIGFCWYSNDSGVVNSSAITMGINWTDITGIDGVNNRTVYCNDSFNNLNSSFSNFTVDTIPPSVVIHLPTAITSYGYIDKSEEFNWTITDISLDIMLYNYNGSNVSMYGGINSTNFNITKRSGNNITIFANDTFSNSNFTYFGWQYNVFENNQTFDNSTLSFSSEVFTINISYNDTLYTNILGYLIYDEVSSTSTKTGGGDNTIFSTTKVIPSVSGSENKTFFWNFTLTNSSGSTIYVTTSSNSNNQSVDGVTLNICDATYQVPYVNFTFEEEISGDVSNGTFSATFEYWITTSDGSDTANYSFTNASINPSYAFCTDPNYTSINVNMNAQYNGRDYVQRTYYFNNATLTNVTNNITLYQLNDTEAVKFFITVKEGILAFTDATVTISKFFVGEGIFKTIGIRETDDAGKFVEYLDLDQDYRFIITRDGVNYGVIDKTSTCEEAPCEIELQIESVSPDMWESFDDYYADNVQYLFRYNDTLKIVSLIFVDTTGLANYVRLHVYETNSKNSTLYTVCNDTFYSSSGTITCNMTGEAGDFTAKAYLSRSPEELIDILRFTINLIREAFSNPLEGVLIAMFLIITIALVGAWSPSAGIILTTFAVLMMKMLGFVAFGWTTVSLIFILGIIIIVKVKQ